MNFVYDIEKDDFLNELEVAINPFRWLFGRSHLPNQRASGNVRELTSLGIFTERTKKLAESTSFREFTERKRKLIEPTRLRILTERTKQRLWLLLIENSRKRRFSSPVENVEEWLEPRIQLRRIYKEHETTSVDQLIRVT